VHKARGRVAHVKPKGTQNVDWAMTQTGGGTDVLKSSARRKRDRSRWARQNPFSVESGGSGQ